MFMPSEPSFSFTLQNDPNIYNYAWDKKIVIVSPTTLLATLKTVASVWKQERQTKNALEIARQSGKPVLLVAVKGSGNIMKKGRLFVSGGSVELHVFPPEIVEKESNRKEKAVHFQQVIASFVD
jgi:1-acyl-sn-glycerol-3-phosphate acyltransferase